MGSSKHQVVLSSNTFIAPTIKRKELGAWLVSSVLLGILFTAVLLVLTWNIPIYKPAGGLWFHLKNLANLWRSDLGFASNATIQQVIAYKAKMDALDNWGRVYSRFYLSSIGFLISFPMLYKSYMTARDKLIHIRGSKRLENDEALAALKTEVAPMLKDYKKDFKHIYIHPKVPYPPKRWNATFAIGAAGSGKTSVIGPIIKQAFDQNHRSFMFDVKSELTAIFFNEKNPAHILIAPWDARSAVWDIAKDVTNGAEAAAFMDRIIPEGGNDPMWSNAAKIIGTAVVIKCQALRGKNWGWKELADGMSRRPGNVLIERDGFATQIIGDCEPLDASKPYGPGYCTYKLFEVNSEGELTGKSETKRVMYDLRREKTWNCIFNGETIRVTESGRTGFKFSSELGEYCSFEIYEENENAGELPILKRARLESITNEQVEIWGLQKIVEKFQPNAALLAAGDENNVTFYGMTTNLLAFMSPVFTLAEAWGDSDGRKFSLKEWTTIPKSKIRQIILQGSDPFKPLSQALNKAIVGYIAALVNSPATKKSEDPMWFFFDEFPQMGKVENVGVLIEVGRSKGCRVIITAQDKNQIKLVYSEEQSAAWLAMCNTQIICRVSPGDTAEWLSKIIGKREVERISVTESAGAGSGKSTSRSMSQAEQVLYHPSELSQNLGLVPGGIRAIILSPEGGVYELFFPFANLPEICPGGVEADWLLPTQEKEARRKKKEAELRKKQSSSGKTTPSLDKREEGRTVEKIVEQERQKILHSNYLAEFERLIPQYKAPQEETVSLKKTVQMEIRGPNDYEDSSFIGRSENAVAAYETIDNGLEGHRDSIAEGLGVQDSVAASGIQLTAVGAALLEQFKPRGKPPEQVITRQEGK